MLVRGPLRLYEGCADLFAPRESRDIVCNSELQAGLKVQVEPHRFERRYFTRVIMVLIIFLTLIILVMLHVLLNVYMLGSFNI